LVIAGIGCAANVGLLPTDADIGNACAQTIAATKAVVRKNDHILLLSHYPPVLEETEAYASVSPDIFSLDVGDVLRKLEPVALVHGHSHFLQLHQERWRGTMVACAGPDWGLLTVDVERGHTTYSPWVGA
jgi:Icc-related predicted phosphoesterase